jgi:hypothetical protein
MNWKGYGRKHLQPDLKYYPRNVPGLMRKTTGNLS